MTVNRITDCTLTGRCHQALDREARWFQEHRLLLEAWAWKGFQAKGSGLLVVRATTTRSGPWPWSDEPGQFRPFYLTGSDAQAALECLGDKTSKETIRKALRTYEPSQEAIAMVLFGERPMVVKLEPGRKHFQDSLRQLERRHQEFMLEETNAS